MRILLDECLDWRLCRYLEDHECVSVRAMGWSGLTNGKLLREAEQEFEVFVTTDRNLLFQQNLAKFNLAIIVLEAHSTRLSDTLPLMSEVLVALKTIQAKEVVWIALSGEL
jgi:predicted nuclease of predicted toxin-antitoxin system